MIKHIKDFLNHLKFVYLQADHDYSVAKEGRINEEIIRLNKDLSKKKHELQNQKKKSLVIKQKIKSVLGE